MRPRLFAPRSFITPATPEALMTLPGYAWDVITAPQFAGALGVPDKMLVNRWLYRQPDGMPPFERAGLWIAGQGSPRVIRKDRALAWAEGVPLEQCWAYAARDLARMGWPDLSGPADVQAVLTMLFNIGALQPLHRPRDPAVLHKLFADDDSAPAALAALQLYDG